MRKLYLILLALVILSTGELTGQDLFPCGTVAGRSPWLLRYQANPDAFPKNLDTLLHVPLSIHLVGNDQGEGFLPVGRLLEALCRLNLDFEESNIRFFIEGDLHYHANLAWYTHPTVVDGAFMMFENNIPNTINCYFVSNPAGNAGYNLPYAGIALAKSTATDGSHTWAHEIGHALSIQHPFLGWEGGQTHDGSIPPDFSAPAPTHVTYNYTFFQDTLILDTLIIDTALVERVDGSNCHLAADGFCDTAPDYLAQGWLCNAGGQSNIEQTDPNGATFRSDGSLIMNYAVDNCQARFTPEQIGAMRANLYDEKPELLYNQNPEPALTGQPVELLFPLAGEAVDPNGVYFEWTPAANATHYLIQVSRLPNFNQFLTQEQVIPDLSSAVFFDLQPDKTYYWRVRPFNPHSFCAPFSEVLSFATNGAATGAREVETSLTVRAYPNPATAGRRLFLHSNRPSAPQPTAFHLYDLTGRPTGPALTPSHSGSGETQLLLPAHLPAGLYLLGWEQEGAKEFIRVVIR